ncbi:hypothetical protein FA95DRAFT_1232873 [Auriscalpium vulgare]|uniref:Uncharacterized protein n=1 Tax=Auriscalpium vulgare TaxID=40419 RepID=A0ACB8RSX8_9AGAM|nr:hypothetical protein FA95DRAFT_1232873 [Auriscalpium vulgare]
MSTILLVSAYTGTDKPMYYWFLWVSRDSENIALVSSPPFLRGVVTWIPVVLAIPSRPSDPQVHATHSSHRSAHQQGFPISRSSRKCRFTQQFPQPIYAFSSCLSRCQLRTSTPPLFALCCTDTFAEEARARPHRAARNPAKIFVCPQSSPTQHQRAAPWGPCAKICQLFIMLVGRTAAHDMRVVTLAAHCARAVPLRTHTPGMPAPPVAPTRKIQTSPRRLLPTFSTARHQFGAHPTDTCSCASAAADNPLPTRLAFRPSSSCRI